MDEGELLFILQDEVAPFATSAEFTRTDRAALKTKLEQLELDGFMVRVILSLLSGLRVQFREASLRSREDISREEFERAVQLFRAAKQGDVINYIDAKSTASSEARNTMGDQIDIGGNVQNSAVGSSARFNARDVNGFLQAVDQSTINDDIKSVLKRARKALESEGLSSDDKDDVADDLAKFSAELEKPVQDVGRVQRIWNRIKDVAPGVAAILSSVVSISKLLGNAAG